VYGEAETGKTSLAIQCSVSNARKGLKTIFVDSDGMFSPLRLSHIAHDDFQDVSPLIFLVRPTTFQEQSFTIDHLEEYLSRGVGLVVFDTITSLYRVEFGSPEDVFTLNRELNRQIACLAQIAKTHKVAILLTSQVRGVFVDDRVEIEPTAKRVLWFWSDVIINLKRRTYPVIEASIEKAIERQLPVRCYLKIEKNGVHEHVQPN
jgi:RecA/RadA recombinase